MHPLRLSGMVSRGNAAVVIGAFSAVLIGALITVPLQKENLTLPLWWPVVMGLACFMGLVAVGLLLPNRVLAFPVRQAAKMWPISLAVRQAKQQRQRSTSLFLTDCRFILLPMSGGKNADTIRIEVAVVSCLLSDVRVTELRIEVTDCSWIPGLKGEIITSSNSLVIKGLAKTLIKDSTGNNPVIMHKLSDGAYRSVVEVARTLGTPDYLNAYITLTGFEGKVERFRLYKGIMMQVENWGPNN